MSRFSRFTTGIIAALLTIPPLGGAQAYAAQDGQAPAAPFQRLHTGDRVKIDTTDGHRVSGRIGDLSAQSVTITSDDGTTSLVTAARAGRIVLRDPVSNGAGLGAGIGLGAGLLAGLGVSSVYANEGTGSGGGVLLLAGLGAA